MCDWDDKSEDGQRMKNLLLFKFYGTDKEMEEAAPCMCVVVVIFVLLFFIFGRG